MNKRTPSRTARHTDTENKSRSSRKAEDTGDAAKARRSVKKSTSVANSSARDIEAELVRFRTGDRSIDFNIDITLQTVWASQRQIADLFGVDRTVVSRHLSNLFAKGELDEKAVSAKNARTASDGKTYEIREFNLDAILGVGYRISSKKASAFRAWASEILQSYIVKGHALNERRLKSDVEATESLSARLRAIRSDERHVFAKVRDFFKEAAIDYDGSTQACRSFFALLQDKFHYAASGLTACQLIIDRADHKNPNMGLTTFAGDIPTIGETRVGKNYLSEKELHILHIVSEQFLLYVQSNALRNIEMTMRELARKFDDLLKFNNYEVFVGYARDYQKSRAEKHAAAEYARFLMRQRKKVA